MTQRPVANLTVAIATLGRPHGLARCLDAIRYAQVLPAEILVVDQSDDDETERIVERVRQSDPSVVYLRQRRFGLSASRNAAITHARSPYLAVTDDDCVPDQRWVAMLSLAFSMDDAPDAVTGRVLPLGPEREGHYAVSTRAMATQTDFTGLVAPWLVGTGGNFAASCAWLKRIGLFDERLGAGSPGGGGEDMDVIYRLTRANARIRYEPKAIVFHERQPKARRIATRTTYGRGMGAFCGLWVRRHDPYALYLLSRWTMSRARAFATAALRGQWERVHEERLMLAGTVRGFLYGLGASPPRRPHQDGRAAASSPMPVPTRPELPVPNSAVPEQDRLSNR